MNMFKMNHNYLHYTISLKPHYHHGYVNMGMARHLHVTLIPITNILFLNTAYLRLMSLCYIWSDFKMT